MNLSKIMPSRDTHKKSTAAKAVQEGANENMERIFKSFSRRRQAAYKRAVNNRLVAASDSFGGLHTGPIGNRARVATWHVLIANKKGRIEAQDELFS